MKKKRKLGRKLLSFLLTLAMIVGLMPGMGMTVYAATWSGEGTQSNPYLISGLDDLINLRDSVNAGTEYSGNYFKLTADIDCGTDNWAPIGMGGYDNQGYEVNNYFKGTFDGNGKTVTYHVANANDNYKGLFYKIPVGATVKNLLVTGSISGSRQYYGGIAGENGGTIQNCSSFVSITGSTSFYGGIAGLNKKGTIDHCVASGALTKNGSGYAYIAGITGQNDTATVRDCVSLCDISAVNATQYNYAGRVIGRNVSNGTAADCYYLSTANITGDAVNADNATGKTADEFKAIGETAYNAGYTVYAQALGYTPHIHNFTYSADGATITAKCSAGGCGLANNQATLTIAAEGGTYDGTTTYSATVTNNIPAVDGDMVGDVAYFKVDTEGATTGGTAQDGTPIDAGCYYVSVTLTSGSNTYNAVKAFTIAKANPTANAPTGLTATYGDTLDDVTLTNPSGNTAGTWAFVDAGTTSVGNVGTNTFKANFTPQDTGNYNSKENVDVTVTVGKAANPATVTNTATVTKGGNAVDLSGNVTKNGATGDVSYAINGETNGCTLSGSTLTSGTNAGTVTVNVTIAEDTNYNALAATPITVTISDKGTQTITASDVTAAYGETGKSISATTDGDGTLIYAVKSGDAVTVDASTGALTISKVGTAVITVTAAETDGYALAMKDVTVTVSKAAPTVTAPTAKTLNYTGSPVLLVNAGSTGDGTLYYALGENGTTAPDFDGASDTADKKWSTSIPTATNVGTYYVWYKAVGDETHTDSEAKCITVTISSESSGGGGGSSSSGGGSSTPSTPTTPTESYTVPVSGESTVNVTASISNETAVVSDISKSEIDKIIDAGNSTGTNENISVTIDLSQAKSEVTSVQLTKETVEKLTEAVNAHDNLESVEIKMSKATVELDGKALSAVSEQAEGSSIKLVVKDTQTTKLNASQQESLKQFTSAQPFQAYFESKGKEIHDFKGGKATVSIKFSPETGKDVKYYHMYYLPLAGAIERYETRYIDGMLNFVTGHFSDYAIVYDETRKNETGKEDEDDNTDTDDNNGTDDGKTTEETSETTANGKTAYQNALSINKGLKVSQTGNKITVSWGKVSGADRYEIYAAYCTDKFGKKPVKIITKKDVTSVTITKLNGKKLVLTKNFKAYVVAYKTVDGSKKKLGKTITAHIVGRKNKTYTNVKAIKLAKNKTTIKVGKTYKIKASVVLVDSKKKMLSDKHAATFRYASSNKKIAAVDKNGKVIAKKVGTCYIWVYAKNGYAKKVKITVK